MAESPSQRNAHRFGPAAPDETHVFGSCSPGWHTAADQAAAVDDWLSFMDERGIVRVCCLLTDDALIDRYRDAFGPERVCHAPIPDRRLVEPATLTDDVLPFLDAGVAADERVVVQGLSGIGRVGQVLAAWLAHDRGYAPERALEAVERVGRCATVPVERGHADRERLLAVLSAVRA